MFSALRIAMSNVRPLVAISIKTGCDDHPEQRVLKSLVDFKVWIWTSAARTWMSLWPQVPVRKCSTPQLMASGRGMGEEGLSSIEEAGH